MTDHEQVKELLANLNKYRALTKHFEASCKEIHAQTERLPVAYPGIPEFEWLVEGSVEALKGASVMRSSITRLVDRIEVWADSDNGEWPEFDENEAANPIDQNQPPQIERIEPATPEYVPLHSAIVRFILATISLAVCWLVVVPFRILVVGTHILIFDRTIRASANSSSHSTQKR